jgi:hypothetical protein
LNPGSLSKVFTGLEAASHTMNFVHVESIAKKLWWQAMPFDSVADEVDWQFALVGTSITPLQGEFDARPFRNRVFNFEGLPLTPRPIRSRWALLRRRCWSPFEAPVSTRFSSAMVVESLSVGKPSSTMTSPSMMDSAPMGCGGDSAHLRSFPFRGASNASG